MGEKIESYIQIAREEGGEIGFGGGRPSEEQGLGAGAYLLPTVVTGLDGKSSRAATEEVFGPFVTIHSFYDPAEAVELNNCVKYGLDASMYTNDLSIAQLCSKQLDVGMVYVNCCNVRDKRTAFGGMKWSGVSREGGSYSLDFYSETQNIFFNQSNKNPKYYGHPNRGVGYTQRAFHTSTPRASSNIVGNVDGAPKPVGAYPFSRWHNDTLYVSGIGPRDPQTNEVPGGPITDPNYDVKKQTHAVIKNLKTILEASNSSLDRVLDVQVFLVNMDRDFKDFNEVYREYFENIQATRTTCAIRALPTPIAVEFKVIAH